MSCHSLLRSIFLNEGLNLHLLHQLADSLLLSHGSAFDYVSTSKGKGYIRNTHLTSSKPKTSTKASSGSKAAHIKNPRNRTVNLRTGPGKKYKVIAEYRPGTKVTILKRGSAWFKVKVGGRTGYIMRKYIALD